MKKKITALLVLILLGSCNWFLPKPGGTKHLDCKILNYTLKIYQTSKNIENEVLNLSAVASDSICSDNLCIGLECSESSCDICSQKKSYVNLEINLTNEIDNIEISADKPINSYPANSNLNDLFQVFVKKMGYSEGFVELNDFLSEPQTKVLSIYFVLKDTVNIEKNNYIFTVEIQEKDTVFIKKTNTITIYSQR